MRNFFRSHLLLCHYHKPDRPNPDKILLPFLELVFEFPAVVNVTLDLSDVVLWPQIEPPVGTPLELQVDDPDVPVKMDGESRKLPVAAFVVDDASKGDPVLLELTADKNKLGGEFLSAPPVEADEIELLAFGGNKIGDSLVGLVPTFSKILEWTGIVVEDDDDDVDDCFCGMNWPTVGEEMEWELPLYNKKLFCKSAIPVPVFPDTEVSPEPALT